MKKREATVKEQVKRAEKTVATQFATNLWKFGTQVGLGEKTIKLLIQKNNEEETRGKSSTNWTRQGQLKVERRRKRAKGRW
jgi:hypothetical protein